MKNLSLIIFLFLLVSCAPIRVNYDYESEVDFSKYKTYNYYSNINSGLSELDTERLLNALDEGLQAKGLGLSETPDFYIDIKSNTYQEVQNSSVGVGVGGTGGNVGGGVSVGIPIGASSLKRNILIDFVDTDRNALIWQANTTSNYKEKTTPLSREQVLRKIVIKALSKF